MKRVLIVEDTSELGRLLVAAIATIGSDIKAEVMPSAEEAYMEMIRKPADLLITDIRLPGMTGTELLTKTRKRFPNTRIIVMTGLPDPALRERAIKAGADVFFNKPLEMEEFLDSISRLLNYRQSAEASPPAPAGQPPTSLLSDVLSDLRKRLGAESVILLNENGRVAAQAGQPPAESIDSGWASDLLSVAAAGGRLSRRLGAERIEGMLILRSPQKDLLLVPIRRSALVLIMPSGIKSQRLPMAIEEVLGAQAELLGILEAAGRMAQTAKLRSANAKTKMLSPLRGDEYPSTRKETDAERKALQNLSDLLAQAGNARIPIDPEAYWDSAVSHNPDLPANPAVLSYEQALKLGFGPGQNSR